jgi:multiple sugar transport system ATP-binding protein
MAPKDRDVAMVFQSYALYPHMNVYDNLAHPLHLRRTPRPEIEQRVRRAAEMLGIADLLTRKPKELSGGQRQRVALGRAIVRDPEVFLMDEPLSNLDAKLRVRTRTELIRLHERLRATIIYVTHDQQEAMTLGDRIAVLHNGVLQQLGAPQVMYSKPANVFVAGFIGSPSMNFLDASLVSRDEVLYVEAPGLSLQLPPERAQYLERHNGRSVVLGVRPEHLYDARDVESAPPGSIMDATVDVVEPMGNEVFVYLSTAGKLLTSRMSADTDLRRGQKIQLVIDVYKMHLFDLVTQRTIL